MANQLTKEEKELLKEFDRELAEFGVITGRFEKSTQKQIAQIEKDLEKQKSDFDKLEGEIIAFEEDHKDEIDSLAIKSILGE